MLDDELRLRSNPFPREGSEGFRSRPEPLMGVESAVISSTAPDGERNT